MEFPERSRYISLLLLSMLLSQLDLALSQISTLSPHVQTGYSGTRLTYSCSAPRGVKYWFIDNVFAETSEAKGHPTVTLSRDGLTSWLSLEASPSTNNSVVTCLLYNPPADNEETNATVRVQGPVDFDGSSDIGITQNVSSITLSWTPPYTLPETETDFRVIISTLGHSDSITTAQSSYTFSYSALDIDPCDSDRTVNFTVTGVNPAGEGEPAFISVLIPQDTSQCGETNMSTGKLGPPTDLTANVMENSVTLTWRPPSILSEIAHYRIKAIDSLRTSLIARAQTIIPSHSFAYADLHINRCSDDYQLTLSVYGVNHAGAEGVISNITVAVSQDHRYCPPSPTQGSATEQRKITTIALLAMAQTAALSKDKILYISVAGTLVLVLLITACITISTFVLCYLQKKKQKQKDLESLPDIKAELNCSYGITQARNSPADKTPHDPEDEVKNPLYIMLTAYDHEEPQYEVIVSRKDYE